jgi:hypothetical protein
MSTSQQIEGIDREQLKKLRKRSPQYRTDEDKWRHIYQILYPEVYESDVPSPCEYVEPNIESKLLIFIRL